MNVAWPISTEYGEESRYNTLLQISIGQEEVDEVITRDIHRTFPEHPQFGFAQGQQALFRVLKAYSLHDLEVRYMAHTCGRAPGFWRDFAPCALKGMATLRRPWGYAFACCMVAARCMPLPACLHHL